MTDNLRSTAPMDSSSLSPRQTITILSNSIIFFLTISSSPEVVASCHEVAQMNKYGILIPHGASCHSCHTNLLLIGFVCPCYNDTTGLSNSSILLPLCFVSIVASISRQIVNNKWISLCHNNHNNSSSSSCNHNNIIITMKPERHKDKRLNIKGVVAMMKRQRESIGLPAEHCTSLLTTTTKMTKMPTMRQWCCHNNHNNNNSSSSSISSCNQNGNVSPWNHHCRCRINGCNNCRISQKNRQQQMTNGGYRASYFPRMYQSSSYPSSSLSLSPTTTHRLAFLSKKMCPRPLLDIVLK